MGGSGTRELQQPSTHQKRLAAQPAGASHPLRTKSRAPKPHRGPRFLPVGRLHRRAYTRHPTHLRAVTHRRTTHKRSTNRIRTGKTGDTAACTQNVAETSGHARGSDDLPACGLCQHDEEKHRQTKPQTAHRCLGEARQHCWSNARGKMAAKTSGTPCPSPFPGNPQAKIHTKIIGTHALVTRRLLPGGLADGG